MWSADGTLLVASDTRAPPATPQRRVFAPRGPTSEDGGYQLSALAEPTERRGQLLVVSHPRLDAAGRFAGVVAAAITPSYFYDFYTELGRTQPGMSISLFLADGAIVTRAPRRSRPAST